MSTEIQRADEADGSKAVDQANGPNLVDLVMESTGKDGDKPAASQTDDAANAAASPDEQGDKPAAAQTDDAAAAAKGDKPAGTADDASAGTDGDAPAANPQDAAAGDKTEIAPPSQPNDGEAADKPADGKVELRPELKAELEKQMEEFKASLEANNFEIDFARGEGPWNAIMRFREQAQAKAAAGETLTPKEQAFANVSHDDVLTEARRMRDRDFAELKTEDGKPRNWYKVGETSTRWSGAEIEEMMKAKEAEVRTELEKKQLELEEKEKAAPAEPSDVDFFDPKYNEIGPIDGDPAAAGDKLRENAFDPKYNTVPDAAQPGTDAVNRDSAADGLPPVSITDGEDPGDGQREVEEKVEGAVVKSEESPQFPSAPMLYRAFADAGIAGENWTASNEAQSYLIKSLSDISGSPEAKAGIDGIPRDVIDSKASVGEVAPVNEFLKSKGLDMQLSEIGPGELAFASTLTLSGEWNGKKDSIEKDGEEHPAVFLERETYKVGDQLVTKLYEKDGIKVFAMPVPEGEMSGRQALEAAKASTPGENSERSDYDSVRLPMISKDVTSDLTELVGMTSAEGTRISQAKMQTKLDIDENGFDVKQGFGAVASRGLSFANNTLQYDGPFVVWAVHEGSGEPLFASRVEQSDWADPKARREGEGN